MTEPHYNGVVPSKNLIYVCFNKSVCASSGHFMPATQSKPAKGRAIQPACDSSTSTVQDSIHRIVMDVQDICARQLNFLDRYEIYMLLRT